MSDAQINRVVRSLLFGVPVFVAAVAALGLYVYSPLLWMLPGLGIGLFAWGRLLYDVLVNGLL